MLTTLFRYLKILTAWLELIISTIPLYLLSYLPHKTISSFYPRLFRIWSNTFAQALGVNLKLHQKNIRTLPPVYILIANHPSAFEDIGIPALFNVSCLAKEEVRHWWVSGKISEAAGTLFVKRESRNSRNNAKQQIIDRLKQGKSVALYPEGGCKGKRLFESFRYGAFDISKQAGIPIVPVFIHYECQNDFAWPDGIPLWKKIIDIMLTQNPTANYYLYDAFLPENYDSIEQYNHSVRQQFLLWQERYLD